jgi:hypothetical protein
MARHYALRVVYCNLTPPSGWLQRIGATFRNATLSFVVNNHPGGWTGSDLMGLADNCSDHDGGDGDCGDDACDDNWQRSLCWLGTGTGWRVLRSRRGSCRHADL